MEMNVSLQLWSLKAHDAAWEIAIEAVAGPHAHSELRFSDGKFFSSTQELGPRFANHKDLFDEDDSHWDITDIPCAPEDEHIVRRLAEMVTKGIDGHKQTYGMDHILTDFLPVPIATQTPDEWICSQSVAYVLQSIGLFMGYDTQQLSQDHVYHILLAELPAWAALRKEMA